jgi:hypothetical protein
MAEPKDKMKEKEKAKGGPDDMTGDRGRDRDRMTDGNAGNGIRDKASSGQASDASSQGKKRWWWPFGE